MAVVEEDGSGRCDVDHRCSAFDRECYNCEIVQRRARAQGTPQEVCWMSRACRPGVRGTAGTKLSRGFDSSHDEEVAGTFVAVIEMVASVEACHGHVILTS